MKCWELGWKWEDVIYLALGVGVPFKALALAALADKYCSIKVFLHLQFQIEALLCTAICLVGDCHLCSSHARASELFKSF